MALFRRKHLRKGKPQLFSVCAAADMGNIDPTSLKMINDEISELVVRDFGKKTSFHPVPCKPARNIGGGAPDIFLKIVNVFQRFEFFFYLL